MQNKQHDAVEIYYERCCQKFNEKQKYFTTEDAEVKRGKRINGWLFAI